MNWWQRFRNRDRLERELNAELRYHFDRQVDDYVRTGMSEDEARRRARLDLGGDDQLKESCRDARGTRWVGDIGQDLWFAARLLLKDGRFTLPALLALALGIGMNGTMFTIVNAMVRGLPIDSPERIMSIHARDAAGRWRGFGVSYLDFREFQAATKTFSGLAAFNQSTFSLGDDGRAGERASAAYVSSNTFQLLGKRRRLAAILFLRMISLVRQRSSSWAAAFGTRGITQTRLSSAAACESTACPPP